MEPYSTGSRDGGVSPAGTPPAAQGWSGQGMPGTPPAAQGWSGQGTPGTQGAPAWGAPNIGVPPPPGVVPFAQQGDSKWPALRLIASILKIVAWVEGGLGVISALVAGVTLSATIGAGGFLLTLFLLVVVAVGFLLTYATSEIIMLFISIEKNTREK